MCVIALFCFLGSEWSKLITRIVLISWIIRKTKKTQCSLRTRDFRWLGGIGKIGGFGKWVLCMFIEKNCPPIKDDGQNLMFSQRNNPYCDLLHFVCCKESAFYCAVQVFMEKFGNL